jgi:uncharacterized phage-associated protein
MMPIRVDSASKYLCELSSWSLSNLELQKLLYLSQVQHAASNDGAELMDARFQAWDYGPVIPRLYRNLRIFGAESVDDVFYEARPIRPDTPSRMSLDTVWWDFGGVDPGELIEVTHWERGAWAKYYEPGVKGIAIPHQAIVAEARNRTIHAREWRNLAA